MSDVPQPATLAEAIAPFGGALINQQTRRDIQTAADSFLRRAILLTGWPAHLCPQTLVGVMLSAADSIHVYLKARAGLEPLRLAGFKLQPFVVRGGFVMGSKSDDDADGWQIEEPAAT